VKTGHLEEARFRRQSLFSQCWLEECTSGARASPYAYERVKSPNEPFELQLLALDRIGLLMDITQALKEMNVEITGLFGRQVAAPELGKPRFLADMRLSVPNTLSEEELRASLRKLEETRAWQLTLVPEAALNEVMSNAQATRRQLHEDRDRRLRPRRIGLLRDVGSDN
jgi:hypothetical protein